MKRAFAILLLTCATACPRPIEGSLAKTTIYVDDTVENAPEDGRAARVAETLPALLRQALRDRNYRIVTNPSLPHELTARLRTSLKTELAVWVRGSVHVVISAGDQVVEQVDVFLPSGDHLESSEYMAYYLSSELADGMSRSARLAEFARGVRPVVVSSDGVRGEAGAGVPRVFATGAPQPNAWALVVGIERYRDAPAATGARADAEAFAQLATTSLGVPEDQVMVALDDRASRSDLEKHLRWLATNVGQGGRIYLYFSGHGAPEPSNGTSFLLPYDGDPRALEETAIRLSTLVSGLEATRAGEALVLLDSCFSGSGGRSVLPAGARPLVPVQKPTSAPKVAMFTAASGAQISGPAPDGTHGLFTATVLEAIGAGKADADGDGQLSLQELAAWVTPRVARQARKDLREQTPHLVLDGAAKPEAIRVTSGLSSPSRE